MPPPGVTARRRNSPWAAREERETDIVLLFARSCGAPMQLPQSLARKATPPVLPLKFLRGFLEKVF
jgi:hypothetical protein